MSGRRGGPVVGTGPGYVWAVSASRRGVGKTGAPAGYVWTVGVTLDGGQTATVEYATGVRGMGVWVNGSPVARLAGWVYDLDAKAALSAEGVRALACTLKGEVNL